MFLSGGALLQISPTPLGYEFSYYHLDKIPDFWGVYKPTDKYFVTLYRNRYRQPINYV
jgi:hypothetical protein